MRSTALRGVLALLLLAAAAPVPAAHAQAARADAAATPLLDADLPWLLPLLDAAIADQHGENDRMAAAAQALTAHGSATAADARAAAIRAGEADALEAVRRYAPQAAVPPTARYDARCSAGLTASTGGLRTTAAFSVAGVAAARAFYRERGWSVSGNDASGYVLRSPDGRAGGSLASSMSHFRRIAADVQRQGLRGYDHVLECTGIPDGTALTLQAEGALEAEQLASGAVGGGARLPDALRRAGLTAAQWERIHEAVWQADMDRQMPGGPSPAPTSAEEAAVRRANVRWLERNQDSIEPRLRAAMNGG